MYLHNFYYWQSASTAGFKLLTHTEKKILDNACTYKHDAVGDMFFSTICHFERNSVTCIIKTLLPPVTAEVVSVSMTVISRMLL